MAHISKISDIFDKAESERRYGLQDRKQAGNLQASLLFRLGEFLLAVPADSVTSVIASESTTKIPSAPAYILGLVPHGEGALTVLDLADFLNLKISDTSIDLELSERRILIIRVNELEAGLLCDKALGVINIEESEYQEVSILKGGKLPEFLENELVTSEGRAGLLNVAKLLEAASIKS